jgi:hypothetical protein
LNFNKVSAEAIRDLLLGDAHFREGNDFEVARVEALGGEFDALGGEGGRRRGERKIILLGGSGSGGVSGGSIDGRRD